MTQPKKKPAKTPGGSTSGRHKSLGKAKKGGQPSKKDKIHYDGVRLCYSRGFTDKETALALQITARTLDNWKVRDPEFFQSLKNWKDEADHKVERSLYQRACGGEWGGRFYPPDTTAMIFWLKNRQPKRWRDAREIAIPDGLKIEIVRYADDPNTK